DRVPASHSMYMQSRIAVAKVLMSDENAITQMILDKLAQTVGSISSGGGIVHQLAAGVYNLTAKMLVSHRLVENSAYNILGCKLVERELRLAAEAECREAAHFASASEEKTKWVSLANTVRPITLF
ncbi:MAG: tetratricopeptide repeat protein, partial [Bacillota bacterium]|nr:tetratricopeptide repeat protein [Bacillota bacterium]